MGGCFGSPQHVPVEIWIRSRTVVRRLVNPHLHANFVIDDHKIKLTKQLSAPVCLDISTQRKPLKHVLGSVLNRLTFPSLDWWEFSTINRLFQPTLDHSRACYGAGLFVVALWTLWTSSQFGFPMTFPHWMHNALWQSRKPFRRWKKEVFLDVLVTTDEKWIYSVSRIKRKVWVMRGQNVRPPKSTRFQLGKSKRI